MITVVNNAQTLIVQDRTATGSNALHAVMAASQGLQLQWCGWVSDKRVLCALSVPTQVNGVLGYGTRLVAADGDGQNLKTLMDDGDNAAALLNRILAWDVPGKPGTVLLVARPAAEAKELGDTRAHSGDASTVIMPSVYELNTLTGDFKQAMPPHAPLQFYLADAQGQVALGWAPWAWTRNTTFVIRRHSTGVRLQRSQGI